MFSSRIFTLENRNGAFFQSNGQVFLLSRLIRIVSFFEAMSGGFFTIIKGLIFELGHRLLKHRPPCMQRSPGLFMAFCGNWCEC
jgi:hypothetical protein